MEGQTAALPGVFLTLAKGAARDGLGLASIYRPAGSNECVTPIHYLTSDNSTVNWNYHPLHPNSAEIQQRELS